MSTFIDLTSYTALTQYGILVDGTLTSNDFGGAIVVNSGYWNKVPSTGLLTLTSGTSPSGLNLIDGPDALTQLGTLITDIQTVTSVLPSVSIGSGGTNYTFSPSINYTGIAISYTSNTITFDAAGDSNAQFFITSTTSFTFTDTTFILENGARACNIFWLADGEFLGDFTADNSSVPGIIITGNDFLCSSSGLADISLTGHIFSQGDATFTRGEGAAALTINSSSCSNDPIVCYLKGTMILTKEGYVPIEDLKAGMKVVTKGKIYNNKSVYPGSIYKLDPLLWVSKFKVINFNSKSRPICIKKDALGKDFPLKDLYVSPGHSLLINGNMVLAKNMINGTSIYQDKEIKNVIYYHLELQYHSAVVANGVLSESYLAVNNRHVFENSIRLRPKLNLRKMNLY